MLTNRPVEDIDELLNVLEREAQSTISSGVFFSHLLHRVRLLLDAHSVAILAPTGSAWLTIAHGGDFSETIASSFTLAFDAQVQPASINQTSAQNEVCPATLMGLAQVSQATVYWYSVPLRPSNFSKGCLIISLTSAPPPVAVPGMLELLAAFAEVVSLRQMAELEEFLDHRWGKLQQLCTSLLEGSHKRDHAALLVNQLVPIFSAARVSLFNRTSLGRVRLDKVSGASTVDHSSQVVRSLIQLAQPTFENHKPRLRQRQETNSAVEGPMLGDDGTFENAIVLPLTSDFPAKGFESVLVIEWTDYEHLVAATASVVHMLPTLSLAWLQYRRWQRVPRVLHLWGGDRWSISNWGSRTLAACAFGLLAVIGYVFLSAPYPLTIEAVGTIEPKLQRTIFTPLDGYVSELLVDDGQAVDVGEPLARMHSPELELRNEQLVGELRTIQEKRNALQIASNQLNANTSDALINQNRIAAEIKQLETQTENLNTQLELVREESTKNVLRSPIRGVVVARDLQQQLTSRPVRRGDALFRVVDVDGPWHLKIQVVDRDSGYVLKRPMDPAQPADSLRFVLDSLPGEQFDAQVEWVSRFVQNRNGEGCFVEMHADVDRSIVSKSYMGASARAYFRCEDQPTWFVWCRPLVESVQRRLWFWR